MNETAALVTGDDKSMQDFVKTSLKTRGYAYILADSGLPNISLFYADHPDLVLPGLGLSDIDDVEVLHQIRQKSDIPITVVSVREQKWEKMNALDQGVDGYVTKLFNAEELLARIHVGLRHKSSTMNHQERELYLDYFRLDFEKHRLYVRDQEVHLAPLEYEMMVLLVNNSGRMLTHHYIQQGVRGCDTTNDYQSLRVFVAGIRRKIENNTTNPRFMLIKVGVGYRSVDGQKEPKDAAVRIRSRIYRETGVRRGKRTSTFLSISSGGKTVLKKSLKLIKLIP